MVGFAVAEELPNQQAEIISLLVLPPYRQRGIGTRLLYHLEQELTQRSCQQLQLSYKTTTLTQSALEPLLHKLGWQSPSQFVETTTEKIAQAPWLGKFRQATKHLSL